MKQIYAIINQKGGVGKSTTAHALGCALHRRGFRVLFVDLDSQSNLSFSLKVAGETPTSMDVLAREVEIGAWIMDRGWWMIGAIESAGFILNPRSVIRKMVAEAGFEPATCGLRTRRSYQLELCTQPRHEGEKLHRDQISIY